MGEDGIALTHGYVFKVARAADDLNALNAKIKSFIEGDFHRIIQPATETLHMDGEWNTIRWNGLSDPDPMWGVDLGGIVHNLRSALDHLAWNLVTVGSSKPSKDTVFPICQSEVDWNEAVRQRRRSDDRPSPIPGLFPAALAIVEDAQPYKAGRKAERHPLMRLLRLSNIDKHRNLHLARVTAKKSEHIQVGPPGFAKILKVSYPQAGGVVENGTEIAKVKLAWMTEPNPDVKMYVKGRFHVGVAFGEYGAKPIVTMDDLGAIFDAVDGIVARGCDLFGLPIDPTP